MRNFLKENWFKIIIALTIFFVGLSFFYYSVIFLPKKEQIRIGTEREQQRLKEEIQIQQEEEELKKKQEAEKNLDRCLDDADIAHFENWLGECERLGKLSKECLKMASVSNSIEYYEKYPSESTGDDMKDTDLYVNKRMNCVAGCLIPQSTADRYEEMRRKDREECFKKYPQK